MILCGFFATSDPFAQLFVVNIEITISVALNSSQRLTVQSQHHRWSWSSRGRKFNYSDTCRHQPSIECHTPAHIPHCALMCRDVPLEDRGGNSRQTSHVFWRWATFYDCCTNRYSLSDNHDLCCNVLTDAVLFASFLHRTHCSFREVGNIKAIRVDCHALRLFWPRFCHMPYYLW